MYFSIVISLMEKRQEKNRVYSVFLDFKPCILVGINCLLYHFILGTPHWI